MGFLEIITLIASISALVLGVGVSIWAGSMEKPAAQKNETSFNGPRSNYGESIPFVFGTVQVDSPICVFGQNVVAGKPFRYWPTKAAYNTADAIYFGTDEPDTDANGYRTARLSEAQKTDQMQVALDLVLAERVFKNGAPVGSATLLKIWYGDSLLWDGSRFSPPGVSASGTLLDFDPNVNDMPPPAGDLPGGMKNAYSTDLGWWYGGINDRIEGFDDGKILGWWKYTHNGTRYTEGYGLESVRFYVGSGAETGNAWVAAQLQAPLYFSYHKFVRLVFEDFVWGPVSGIDQISAELRVTCPAPEIGDSVGMMPNNRDVNPISMLWVLLSSPEFVGGAKMPPLDVASFSAARAAIATEGLGMSYKLERASKAGDVIDAILQHVDGFLYRDPVSGAMVVRLNRQEVGAVPVFTQKVVIKLTNFAKSTWEASYSQVRVGFKMRSSAPNAMYADNLAIAKDIGLSTQNGLIETLEESSATAYEPDVANQIAARKLAIANTPLIAFDLECTREIESGSSMLNMRPGSTFQLDYEPLQIKGLICKVLGVDFGTLEDNTVRVKVIQDRFVPAPTVSAPKPSAPVPVPLKPDVSIAVRAVITAPYPIARVGMGGDARKGLTSSAMSSDGTSLVYPEPSGYNLDRFFLLAKAPYAGADSFNAQIQDTSTGELIQSLYDVPYTPAGVLLASLPDTSGGTNASYSGLSAVPFTIVGLNPGDTSKLFSGSRRDGKNMLLIGSEWILVQTFTLLSSTSVRVDTFYRMCWDSPIVPTNVPTMRQTWAGLGPPIWILDISDTATTAKKLSQPLQSGLCIVSKTPVGVISSDPLLQDTGGFVGPTYAISFTNVDSGKNNVRVKTTALLQDRANRMLPVRRVRVVWNSGTAFGAAFDTTVITSQSGQTTMQFTLDNGPLYGNTSPREDGSLVKPFDATVEAWEIAEEASPPIAGWSSTPWKKDFRNCMVFFRVNAGAWVAATRPADSSCICNGLPSTGSYTLTLMIYRVPCTGTATEASSMRSTPRGIQFTVNRI